MKDDMNVIIDTREQLPYSFDKFNCNTIKKKLKTGDYSLDGYENEVVIERKSKADLYGSIGKGRDRFEKEFERLSWFKYPALIIECDLNNLLKPIAFSKLSGKTVINTLLSWSIKYGVFIYFACTRELAENLTYCILQKYLFNKKRGTIYEPR